VIEQPLEKHVKQ